LPVLVALIDSLMGEFATIQRHLNSQVYRQLAKLIDISGSFLDPPTMQRLQ
jgi:hypothetical protein